MQPFNPTPYVPSPYGAPLGRASDNLSALIVEPSDPRMALRRVRLNSGGYDVGGAYWGIGQPLFAWSIEITEGDSTDLCSGFLRASSRDAAKAKIRELQPNARFWGR